MVYDDTEKQYGAFNSTLFATSTYNILTADDTLSYMI